MSSQSYPNFFYGLKQSHKYREEILHGLWNYQILNHSIERVFNQWLNQCAICYLFYSNDQQFENESVLSFRHLWIFERYNRKSNELLQCNDCHVCVHRECYDNLSLALNVQILDCYERWFCQRCNLKKQVSKIYLSVLSI